MSEHHGWENLEPGQERAQYDVGWDAILASYGGGAGREERVLRKTVRVALAAEDAFRLYTEDFGTWWPLETHSVERTDAETATFEPRVGGRIVERGRDGREHHWGTVLEWDPPRRFSHTWHPGRAAETGQHVEVRFLADGDGTRVELVHTGWAALGDEAEATYRLYDAGWDLVLGRAFAQRAAGGRPSI